MFEAKAMSYLVGCGITDEVEHKCVGNLVAQAMAIGDIKDIVSARETIKRSFDIETLG